MPIMVSMGLGLILGALFGFGVAEFNHLTDAAYTTTVFHLTTAMGMIGLWLGIVMRHTFTHNENANLAGNRDEQAEADIA